MFAFSVHSWKEKKKSRKRTTQQGKKVVIFRCCRWSGFYVLKLPRFCRICYCIHFFDWIIGFNKLVRFNCIFLKDVQHWERQPKPEKKNNYNKVESGRLKKKKCDRFVFVNRTLSESSRFEFQTKKFFSCERDGNTQAVTNVTTKRYRATTTTEKKN